MRVSRSARQDFDQPPAGAESCKRQSDGHFGVDDTAGYSPKVRFVVTMIEARS
jgi:hypothetical protein